MAQRPSVKGVADVVALIDGLGKITGRAQVIWFLVFGGLFLDAYSNAALSAGLGPMTSQMELTSTQVSILTATAPALAIIFNPVGGWLATRIGRVPRCSSPRCSRSRAPCWPPSPVTSPWSGSAGSWWVSPTASTSPSPWRCWPSTRPRSWAAD